MTRSELNELYTRLSTALTAYELDPETRLLPLDAEPCNAGEALYLAISRIDEYMTNKLFKED